MSKKREPSVVPRAPTAKRPKEMSVASKYFGGSDSAYFGGGRAPLKVSLPPTLSMSPPPATLLLGSQASDNSMAREEAFASNENAFWHILGDALGFARGFHHKGRMHAVDSIWPHLLHAGRKKEASILSVEDMQNASGHRIALPPAAGEVSVGSISTDDESSDASGCVLDYEGAVKRLTAARFAIWDVVGASERAGSLDEAIANPLYNDVRTLVHHVPTIKRLCFVTGVGSAKLFRKAWRGWLSVPGAFTVASDKSSQEVFGNLVPPLPVEQNHTRAPLDGQQRPPPFVPCLPPEELAQGPHPLPHPIELVVLESVSPAHIPRAAAKSNSKRVAAYQAEGRHDLIRSSCEAGGRKIQEAPRASAYAWKRAMWLESSAFADVPSGMLHPAARDVLPFGLGSDGSGRPQDFVDDLHEKGVRGGQSATQSNPPASGIGSDVGSGV